MHGPVAAGGSHGYVSGFGVNHSMESAGLKLRSQLAKIVRGLAEWDPALYLGGS